MITLIQLKQILQHKQSQTQTQKNNCIEKFIFNADHYIVNVEFKDKIYIYVSIDNLNAYNRLDKNIRLLHYAQQNTDVIGYISSTLAYTKTNDVIVQQYLDKNSDIDAAVHAIDYLLRHADILTNSKY